MEVGEKVSMHLAADLFWPTWKSEVGTNLCVQDVKDKRRLRKLFFSFIEIPQKAELRITEIYSTRRKLPPRALYSSSCRGPEAL